MTDPFHPFSATTTPAGSATETGLSEQVLGNLQNLLGGLLDNTQRVIADHGLAFLISIFTLLAAWLLATLLRGFTAKLLRAIGLDLIAERTGLRGFLQRHDIPTAPSKALGWILYAIILYTAFVLVFDLLNLRAASTLLRTVAGYLPQVLAASVLILLGVFLGKWADYVVSRAARVAGLPGHKLLGGGARVAVLLLATVFAINSLGWVSQNLLLGGFGLLLGGGLGAALLFAICARGLAESMLARSFLTALYQPGDRIRIDDTEGTVVALDPCSLRIDCGGHEVNVPNRHLTESKVEILKSSTPEKKAPAPRKKTPAKTANKPASPPNKKVARKTAG